MEVSRLTDEFVVMGSAPELQSCVADDFVAIKPVPGAHFDNIVGRTDSMPCHLTDNDKIIGLTKRTSPASTAPPTPAATPCQQPHTFTLGPS